MVNGSVGMSGRNFDAFVSSQRSFSEPDWAAKIQEKYWRARQKFLAKVERKEDTCIVLSDAKLDAKLQIYRSIDRSCERLTEILESYQNQLFLFANEENALGILLKECGKHDRTKAGKIMALTGKSLTQSSHQRIRLYMPLLRLYQEMETFHSRAVGDTAKTVDKLESRRAQYRASLMWMKDLSEKLDPDVYKQLDRFRRVQNKVRDDKRAFDGMQMDVVQKIDLLMASRCNLMNQIIAPYQAVLLETFEKNQNNFKSVEEIIKSEDLYEYEFKTLKHLNPLKLSDDDADTAPPGQNGAHGRAQASCEQTQMADANLLGNLEDDEDMAAATVGDNNNNKPAQGQSERKASGLVDVDMMATSPPLTSANSIKGQTGTRSRIDSLISVDDNEQKDELANSLDLLDSLFGSSQDASSEPSGEGGASKKREEEVRALRSNLNANLFDLDIGDEAKQVASLLGLSERIGAGSHNKSKAGGGCQSDEEDPLGLLLQEDIFSKWTMEGASGTTSDIKAAGDGGCSKETGGEGHMTANNMDQDLMDIGGSTMPKASGSHPLDDFLA